MIANTHRLIGEFLYNQLSPTNQNHIHKEWFMYGNIKPDISQKYLRMSHYYRDNREIIFSMLNHLLTHPVSVKHFSEHLGVIIHFFCDYACVYHANDYLYEHHSLAKHIKYEVKLHRYAKIKFQKMDPVKAIPFKDVQEIQYYVSELTRGMNEVPLIRSVSQDFEDMVVLALSVMQYVITHFEFNKLLVTDYPKRSKI
ncbi:MULTISPECIES: zinc dependent phospholipase C family protein [Turicibacter]|uniref:Phospholipase C/D domain-containing protein n=1 Tax=Turicibacter faecis TaxID=2963365 RepID=A0ABM8IKI8_9FIRM|nr:MULTISPECIES: zinc dependent phospholipase C family protein [unclassified Turicibacter]MCU7205313.1 zinc dependent phospholipase C family protein [Turicibacter sp. TA25]NCE79216.1 hypothetical protein [Turicibacter sp. TS3]BEH91776.1 hypothetical protein T23_18780 [Turicibacter sp. TC023]